jgi:rhamnogalacturonyl hydrolase YesR
MTKSRPSPRLFAAVGLLLLAPAALPAAADPADAAIVRRVADGILRQTTRRLVDRTTGEAFADSTSLAPRPELSIESKFNAWFYQTWLLTDGMRRTAAALAEPAYRDYGEQNLEFLYRHLAFFERQHAAGMKAAPAGDGSLSPIAFHFRLSDLWHTGLAPLVVERYSASKDPRYEPYLHRLQAYLAGCDRLPDGTLHRARGRLMGDDPYMTVPYLLRWWRHTGEPQYLDAAIQQFLGTHRRLFDSAAGLYRHGWDVKQDLPLGERWGRANGWMLLAHVELLAFLPATDPRREELLTAFRRHAAGLRAVQDSAGGWHQVLDHPTGWIETSCTGMFTYGLARGRNEGWLDDTFTATARRGWTALQTKVTPEGDIVDVCASTDVGKVDYYAKRPRTQGDLHGFGPFLLAGAEILRLGAGPR